MTDYSSTSDALTGFEEPKKNSFLNVLTILTFVGSGVAIISAIYSFFTVRKSYDDLEKLQSSGELDKMPGFMKGMVGPEMLEMTRKSLENRVPILLIGLIAAGLCIYGAMEMRKFKKQGFFIWLIGEVLPIIAGAIFLGMGMFGGFFLFMMIIPVAFIIMYASQLKYMH